MNAFPTVRKKSISKNVFGGKIRAEMIRFHVTDCFDDRKSYRPKRTKVIFVRHGVFTKEKVVQQCRFGSGKSLALYKNK